jgi:hypothetical protein
MNKVSRTVTGKDSHGGGRGAGQKIRSLADPLKGESHHRDNDQNQREAGPVRGLIFHGRSPTTPAPEKAPPKRPGVRCEMATIKAAKLYRRSTGTGPAESKQFVAKQPVEACDVKPVLLDCGRWGPRGFAIPLLSASGSFDWEERIFQNGHGAERQQPQQQHGDDFPKPLPLDFFLSHRVFLSHHILPDDAGC